MPIGFAEVVALVVCFRTSTVVLPTTLSLMKLFRAPCCRTYGDRSTVADVMSLKEMVSDAGAHFIKVGFD